MLQTRAPALLLERQATFLFLRRTEELWAEERETMHVLRQTHTEVDLMADLVQQFVPMLRTRTGELLDDWLAQVNCSNLPELQSFSAGVEKDKNTVRVYLFH